MSPTMMSLVRHGALVGYAAIALVALLARWVASMTAKRRARVAATTAPGHEAADAATYGDALEPTADARVRYAALTAALVATAALYAGARWDLAQGRLALAHTQATSSAEPAPRADVAIRLGALASLVPGTRREGLALLGDALMQRAPFERAAADDLAVVDGLQGRCDRALRVWLAHGAFEQAAQLATACHRPVDAAHAWYALGEFPRASDALRVAHGVAEPGFEARVHLLAHRYALVADVAGHAATQGTVASDAARRRGEALRCVALWAEARTGEPTAVARLDARLTHDPATTSMPCLVLLDDLLGGAERRATDRRIRDLLSFEALDGAGFYTLRARWLQLLEYSLRNEVEQGAYGLNRMSSWMAEEVVIAPESVLTSNEPSFVVAAAQARTQHVAPQDGAAASDASAAASNAVAVALAMGRTDDAQRWLAIARSSDALARADGVDLADTRARLLEAATALALQQHDDTAAAAAIEALHGNDATPTRVVLLESLRRGYLSNLGELHIAVPRMADSDEPTWSLAGGTDGAALAAYLERHDVATGTIAVALAAPHLATGRDAVLAWLRWGDTRRCGDGCPLAAAVARADARARAAYALGAARDGDAYARTAQRFAAALLARDVAVPRAVLEHLDDPPGSRIRDMLP